MGCTWGGPASVGAAPTAKLGHVNASSGTAAPDWTPEVVGHYRALLDEYSVGKQVGKYARAQPPPSPLRRA